MRHENAKDAGIDPIWGADARCVNAIRVACREWQSQETSLGHRGNRIADHEVIKHPNLDQRERLPQPAGDRLVRLAGLGDT